MKTAKVTLADATYYLAFDGEAMFTLRDDFGGTQLALEAIEQDTRESFAATCAIAAVLAERGELLRRRLGYDPGAIPEKDDFLLMVRPFEIVTLKRAIMTAIELGYGREVTSPADDAGGILPYRRSLRSLPGGGSFYGSRRGFRPLGAIPIRTR